MNIYEYVLVLQFLLIFAYLIGYNFIDKSFVFCKAINVRTNYVIM